MPPFILYPNPLLHEPAQLRPVDAPMIEAGRQLRDAAAEVAAYGLAAAHLGMLEPLIVVSVAPDRSSRDYRVLFNPRIVTQSGDRMMDAEGSVSMPGIEVPIERSVAIELGYDDADNNTHTQTFDGFTARVIQHELDQMNGIFFLNRLSRLKRDTAIRKYVKSRR